MKFFSLFVYSLIIIGLTLFGVNVTLAAMINKDLVGLYKMTNYKEAAPALRYVENCSNNPKLPNLSQSSDLRIKKLEEYQTVCGSLATNKLMLFTDMPKDLKDAETNAVKMAATLKEFKKYGVTPIVIVEPTSNWGLIDFLEFNGGFYDTYIKNYFKALKAQGITDQDMGIWVPFPEANIPTWNKGNATQKDFAIAINKYVGMLKTEFPTVHASILLNSASYDNEDYEWAYGEYISLLPYVKDIQPGLIDSFGLQGFPWLPKKTSQASGLTEPSQYLNYLIAVEAAQKLGVKEIWFNTGTFKAKYTQDSINTVGMDYLQRKAILDQVIDEALKTQERGFKVWINLFAEDKSETAEQTDWSYWDQPSQNNNLDEIVFKDFIAKLGQNQIGFTLYDAYPDPTQPKTTPTPKPTIKPKRTPAPPPTPEPEEVIEEDSAEETD